ncbi:hypothetical protein A3C21_02485 [Candidatus Kaiserbacteria bacterium RIFCSPHIGHO2_02_FULL_59_21]|uniref:Methyltransferase type 11 domain-containing protein n=1 Tax=Candidatus Kaiserbacteria bacterium RIFCSPHIGHO2_02_FULL_59_21 TaxID=1798500 RepID=A0A1F6E1W4_9BACT|nr:MAG: hypothetical protein A2766_02415 [Candidatus Kaiserbacteria bacterium RIFCSPHIGHO2_01_FULL_58_22]OGG67653.1 MAG: hypothetical protein A3C21_02485 [Candidatus Kaiserbacteria bacterium RIFCSPHIGHO2_02_FULL_59_21]OGG79029.1 MAG: hypothetical protein A2952_02915 [Candidatus Kaiserbacteria bacterium RIFCSPLOWO2_01_FULL_59_34]OGG87145.1 MAG: hypothetical protein A3I47_00050 [Candidatus Kaiserbacteria bacterium RIFCSPLOWO2_02_FULL_59_19]
MEDAHYETLRSAEDSWWYRGRSLAIERMLKSFSPPPGAALDLGAGYGAMLPLLRRFGPVTAYEIYPECVAVCRERGYENVLSDESALFARKNAFALVGAFDVLEHIKEDVAFVSRLRESIVPGGIIVATVPAHQFLWSAHDVANRHFRRHGKKSLRLLFEENGYEVLALSYWNCSLFPIAAILRLSGAGGGGFLALPRFLNAALAFALYLESLWLSIAPLPMGLSLIAVARRPV